MSSFLTLDATTLFYFNLSRKEKTKATISSYVKNWSAGVEKVEPPFKPSRASVTSSKQPSLTRGSTLSSKLSSAWPDDVDFTDHKVEVISGGLSDEYEILGAEREYAVGSPPKGKKRLTSSV
jgi:hypothetical protein